MSSQLATIIADFETQLTAQVNPGGTTSALQSNVDDDGVTIPNGNYFLTFDGLNSQKEYVFCTVTGMAITNIQSISRQGSLTSGCQRVHRVGASVEITDYANLMIITKMLQGTIALDGTSPLGYDNAPSALTGNQLATVAYVLSVVSGGTVYFDQQVVSNQTSGEAIALNAMVYFNPTDQKWYNATAGITTTIPHIKVGVSKTVASGSGQSITVAISGPVSGFSALTPGNAYFIGTTPGSVTSTDPGYSEFIGYALSTTQILLVPMLSVVYASQISASGTDQSQVTDNATVEFGMVDSTTEKKWVAQSFITTKSKIRGVTIKKIADTGTFAGTVTIALQADSTGSPSGSNLASVTLTNAQWAAIPANGTPEILFGTEYDSAVPGTTYWIVASASTADNSNHPNLAYQNTNVYANGVLKYNNMTDGWVLLTGDLHFTTLEGNIGQIPELNASGELQGFAKMPIVNVYGVTGNAGSATTQFTITNPTGQTFRYTYTGTGTDPVISAATVPIGTIVQILSPNMSAGNNGTFIVTGSGNNYFELTNASGVAENTKTIAGGYLNISNQVWTKPPSLKYITVECHGAGGSGGNTGGAGGQGGTSMFSPSIYSTGGLPGATAATAGTAGGAGGVGNGGDINITGNDGGEQSGAAAQASGKGRGGAGIFGKTYGKGGDGVDGTSGGSGPSSGAGGGGYCKKTIPATSLNYTYNIAVGVKSSLTGSAGTDGLVIVTEYY